jgi:integrase
MPRKPRFPTYPERPHRSGHARIFLYGKETWLGLHGSPESYKRYERLLKEWNDNGGVPPVRLAAGGSHTVADVVARFLAHAEAERTNPDGSRPWGELRRYREAVRPLLALYGPDPAADFGPRRLKAVQKAMATGSWWDLAPAQQLPARPRRPGWCRRVVNRQTIRLQTLWRWAESEELVPAGSHAALATVRGLRRHEHGVREKPRVPPAPLDRVRKARRRLNPIARAAVWLLELTGARPGELCRWTPADILQGGRVEVAPGSYAELGTCWCVWLRAHKTAGDDDADPGRFILLGPRAQRLLRPLLAGRPADRPLFSPAEGRRRQLEQMRRRRRSKVQPSQLDRSRPDAARRPGDAYTPASLTRAIGYACDRAGVPHFSAYQLRHTTATTLGSQGDAEAARIALGHKDLGVTRVYLLDDLTRAARVVARVG